MQLGKINKNYRDRLFKFIFGNPENREWTLSLYNAVNGSNYENADDIWYNTIDDAVYMHMRNDVSFIIENTMSLYEQQSTYCPNMPLRFLIYLAKLYEGYSRMGDFNIYSSKIQRIPRPKCICFYNGSQRKKDQRIIKLSDMYFKGTEKTEEEISGIVEIEVIMLNINYGHNKELLEKSKPLYEYSFFVDKIVYYRDVFKKDGTNYTLEDAINKAIDDLPEDFRIRNFILKNRMEVCDMCLFEYDEERHIKAERADAKEEGEKIGLEKGEKIGLEKGEKKGKLKLLIELVLDGTVSVEQAAKKANMKVEEFQKILDGQSKI